MTEIALSYSPRPIPGEIRAIIIVSIGKSHMFCGCGVITGGDAIGTNMDKSARVSPQEIRNVVRFPGRIRQQMRK